MFAAARRHISTNAPPALASKMPLIIGPEIPPILEKILKKFVPVDLTWVGKDSEASV